MCATEVLYHPTTDVPAAQPASQLMISEVVAHPLEVATLNVEKDRLRRLVRMVPPAWKTNDDGHFCLALLRVMMPWH